MKPVCNETETGQQLQNSFWLNRSQYLHLNPEHLVSKLTGK